MKGELESIRQKMREANVVIDYEDNGDYINLNIVIGNYNLKSYERNRSSLNGHNYDPLSTYKKELHKIILDKNIKPYINSPLSGYCYIEIDKYMKVPKSEPKYKLPYILDGSYRPSKKPDNDNIEKIIYDLLNGLVYVDDAQIIESRTRKFYDLTEDRTEIRIKLYKEEQKFEYKRGKKK